MKKYLTITIAAGLAFVVVGVLAYQSRRITMLEGTVEEIYLSALHQTAEEMDTLSLNMEKALLATDPAHTVTLLHTISRGADSVQQYLSFLPVSHQALLPAQVFAHQLASYTQELLPHLVDQGQLTAEERARLTQHLALCSQLSSQLAMADSAADLEALQLSLPTADTDAVQAKGLPAGEITQDEAIDIARQFVGDQRVTGIQAAPGTSGSLAAYGVTVQTQDVQLNLEITKQGGQVLWMMPETASFPVTQSVQACQEAAVAFLTLQDFAPMEPVHHQVYDGLCVITLVPLQDDVLLYPDLIRVQVRMDTAEVVGLEAHSYWLNHTERSLPQPALTQEEAVAHIAAHAQVQSARLCLIPSGSEEALCYEFTVAYEGETYLIYIDAQSGREVELLKTIPVENGSLTA